MGNLNICIDIDGTITTPYYWIRKANEYFNQNIKPSDVTEYEIHKVLGIPRDEYVEFYKLFGESLHAKAKTRNRARRTISKLAEYNNIFYVTARNPLMTNVTKKWIEDRKLPGDVFLLGSHYKVDKAKELNCHIFIEDRYENAIELNKAGFKVILMDCNYNRLPLPKEITRVKNWDQVYEEIEMYLIETQKREVA